jgi:transcriptional regulator with XRE-family HTH domain
MIARKQRGWTQNELAAQLGTTSATVSRWENGHSTPTDWWTDRLLELLGVAV